MEHNEWLLNNLEKCLREFPLRHVERHVLPELRVSLEQLARKLQRAKLPIKASTLAPLLKERARVLRMEDDALRALVKTVALKGAILKENKEWYAYTANGVHENEEPLSDTIALAARRMQQALRHYKTRGADVEVHLTQLDTWLLLGVSRRSSVVLTLMLAWRPTERHVFATRSSLPAHTANAVAHGLGWTSMEKANLRGKHLDSLLKVLEQDKNCSLQGLLSSSPYSQRAVFGKDGLETDDMRYNVQFAGTTIGSQPARLCRLEGHSRRPFCDDPSSRPMHIGISIESEDVATTLLDMVQVKAIHPNSEWLHLFRSTTSNVIDLDALED